MLQTYQKKALYTLIEGQSFAKSANQTQHQINRTLIVPRKTINHVIRSFHHGRKKIKTLMQLESVVNYFCIFYRLEY